MTEWNGFKVGSLYKRTATAPLALVVEILGTPCFGCDEDDCNRAVRLTTLEEGALQTYFIQNHHERSHSICAKSGDVLPHIEVA